MNDVLAVLEGALGDASKILLHHYRAGVSVETKRSSIDLVTAADREAETAVVTAIRARYPGHTILAEEGGGDRSSRPDDRWIIDPLDGTTNFAHGVPIFCVSIAFEHQGKVIAGGIDSPVSGERFLATRGGGAFRNGERIGVSRTDTLGESLVVTGFPYDRRERIDHYLALVRRFLLSTRGVLRLGSAALDLCSIAAGRLDAYWEENLQPWDTAAGMLMVEEAGGRLTDFAGETFSPFGRAVLATNGRVHDQCIELLRDAGA
jgi:myo-inositol-1(or 4)-monophosphatase